MNITIIITAAVTICVTLMQIKSYFRMKHYKKTMDCYSGFSCLLFTVLDNMCKKENLKNLKTEYIGYNEHGQQALLKGSTYESLLCAAGRAILVADNKTCQLILKLINDIRSDKISSVNEEECLSRVNQIVEALNAHLRSYEHGLLHKVCLIMNR